MDNFASTANIELYKFNKINRYIFEYGPQILDPLIKKPESFIFSEHYEEQTIQFD